MRQFPRLIDMSRDQREKFNELKKHIKMGRIPSWMLNPSIILTHNECSPPVAQLNEGSMVSLDALCILGAGEGYVGINARSALRHSLRQPRHIDDIPIKHDPKSAKLHVILDEKEDKND